MEIVPWRSDTHVPFRWNSPCDSTPTTHLRQMPALMIHIVRHGETNENVQGIMQGQLDTDLNDLGRAQAEMLAEALEEKPFKHAFTSDLKRASDVGPRPTMIGD